MTPVRIMFPLVTKVSESPTRMRDDQTGKALYFEANLRGNSTVGRGQRRRKRSSRPAKRSRRWKAPRVRSNRVAFASGSARRPFKACRCSSGLGQARRVDSPARLRKELGGTRVPNGRCSWPFSRPRMVSTGDRRCLGQSAWGKSTSASEAEVGVGRTRERSQQPLSCVSSAGAVCKDGATRCAMIFHRNPQWGLKRSRLCSWVLSIVEVDEQHVA
jgi:hypothetical protein